MTAEELERWIAAVLLAAVAVGWLLRGLWSWLSLSTGVEKRRLQDLVERLHLSEEARETAQAALLAAEERLLEQDRVHREQMTSLTLQRDQLGAEHAQAVALAVRTAEEDARNAWDALAQARHRIGELERALVERNPTP
jgi:hypothetical protein